MSVKGPSSPEKSTAAALQRKPSVQKSSRQARRHGKQPSMVVEPIVRRRRRTATGVTVTFSLVAALGLAATGIATAAPPAPTALPSGAQVMAGQAAVAQSGSRMDITQASQSAILNWQTFNIGSQASVNFKQPNASATALNRVLSSDASQIYGSLTANGRVFLINPSGVIFGSGSSVNVGGLVASTMNISDDDFLAGNYSFHRGNSVGSILNQGTITAASGGFVALLAPEVRNEGIISAKLGTIALAASRAVRKPAKAVISHTLRYTRLVVSRMSKRTLPPMLNTKTSTSPISVSIWRNRSTT